MQTQTLFRNRNYRLLFSASAFSNLADGIAALAFPWLASLISRDPFLISLVAFATRLPWLLLALPVGVITDRADRQQIMVRADILRCILSIAVVWFILNIPDFSQTSEPSHTLIWIGMLCVVAFIFGVAEVFRDNASQTVLPMLVKSDDLEKANGQIWSIEQVMGALVGPPLAGFLIAVSLPLPFGFDAVMFALSGWAIWLIAFPPRKLAMPSGSFWSQLKTGVSWIFQHKVIFQLAVMLGFMNALATMGLTILVLFSQELLGLSAVGHGVLLTAGAAGGIAGGILCPMIVARLGGYRCLMIALAVIPIAYLIIFVTTSPIVVGIALFIEMFAGLLWNVVTVSFRQRIIPEDILGRVNSIYRFFGWGMIPIGALLGGLVVTGGEGVYDREFALRLPYLVAGLGSIVIFLYAAIALKFPRSGTNVE